MGKILSTIHYLQNNHDRSQYRAWIVALCWLCALFAGCQTQTAMDTQFVAVSELAAERQVLVTFAQSAADKWLPGGSSRAYHGGNGWGVPLTLRNKIDRLEKQFQLQEVAIWPIEHLRVHCVVFAVQGDNDVDSVLEQLQQDSDALSAQRLNEFTLMGQVANASETTTYDDPQFELQYGAQAPAVQRLHSISRGKSIKIGIVDTQVDEHHPDLAGQITRQYRYVGEQANVQEKNITHGTAMAGIIAAKANNNTGLVGLAPEASVYVYGACAEHGDGQARCNSFNLLRAIEQAIDDKVEVLNLSLSGPYDPLLDQLLRVAQAQNIIIVAAGSVEPKYNFPASIPGVIGVAGAMQLGTIPHFGEWLLRNEKLSTQAGGGYQFFYGSSVATASISGVAALLRTETPQPEILQLLQQLTQEHCLPRSDLRETKVARLMQVSCSCSPLSPVPQTANNTFHLNRLQPN